MRVWIAGYLFGLLFIVNAVTQTNLVLMVIDWLLGLFCWFVIIVNYYAKR